MRGTLLFLTMSLATSQAPAQSTWYVDSSAPGPGTGAITDPYPSIQQAVDAPATQSGDEIRIAAGAYLESLDTHGKSVALVADGSVRPLIRGNGIDRLLEVTSGEVAGTEFRGLEFVGGTGGLSGSNGGAVLVQGSTASFVDCRFFGNRTCGFGGALAGIDAELTLEDCLLESNLALGGGAVWTQRGELTVRDSRFTRNEAGTLAACAQSLAGGGAISTDQTVFECSDSWFEENVAGQGGALRLDSFNGVAEPIARCTFIRNGRIGMVSGGVQGGAVRVGNLEFEDCAFIRNGGFRGGAAYQGTYRRCRFEGNSATTGGAVYDGDLFDCIVIDNHAIELGSNNPEGGGTHSSRQTRCVFVANTSVLGAGACDNSQLVDRCTIVNNVGFPDFVAVNGASLTNSIVWGNRAVSPVGPVTMVDVNSISFSIVEGDPSTLPGPPLLFGRHVGDAHLLPGSPAIDAASGGLPLDPDGSPADIGALTYDPNYRAAPARFCDPKPTSTGCVPEIALVGEVSVTGSPARVEVSGVPTSSIGLLLLSSDAQGIPFFGGTLCVGGTIVRAGAAGTVSASGCGERLEFPLGAAEVSSVGLAPGDLLFAQAWFRDALNPDGTGVGVSDALVLTVEP